MRDLRLAPMVQICAPPGTGKTTVVPEMVAQSRGEVIIDIDEILTDDSVLGVRIASPSAAAIWPAYDRLWLQFAAIVRRSGHPVIMMVQVPGESDFDAERRDPDTTLLGWEVPEAVRTARLRERGWTDAAVADASSDAELITRCLADQLIIRDSGDDDPATVAGRLLARARAFLEPDPESGAVESC